MVLRAQNKFLPCQLFVYNLFVLDLVLLSTFPFDPCVNKHMFSCHLALNGCITDLPTAISEKLDFATEEFATYFHTNEGVLNGMKNHSLMSRRKCMEISFILFL